MACHVLIYFYCLRAHNRGADVASRDRWGATPLQDAVRNQHLEVARYLSKRDISPFSSNNSNVIVHDITLSTLTRCTKIFSEANLIIDFLKQYGFIYIFLKKIFSFLIPAFFYFRLTVCLVGRGGPSASRKHSMDAAFRTTIDDKPA